MVYVLDAATAPQHAALIDDMHRVRRQVFVEGLGWPLAVDAHGREIDAFDTDAAVYLVRADPRTGRHRASVRLLPSTAPHLLGDCFEGLCTDGVPRGDDIWEITRLCMTPGLPRDEAVYSRRTVCAGVMEFGLLHGIRRYSCVLSLSWLPTFLSPGWEVLPLGPPQEVEGDMLGAFVITVSAQFLRDYRQRHEIPLGVLDFVRPQAA